MSYPRLVLKNQFGEESINAVLGGGDHIDLNFIVDHANGNGLGIRSLKVQGYEGVANVFMHTSATPASGNPNPLAGFIVVELSKPFAGYVGGYYGCVSPLSGTNINVTSGLTVGQAYVITSVGTTTPAQWQALGFPAAFTPIAGASFIATSSSAGSGTGVVQVPSVSGVGSIEAVGDLNKTADATTGGAQLIFQVLAPTSGTNTAPVVTAPADNTVIGLRLVMLEQAGAEAEI